MNEFFRVFLFLPPQASTIAREIDVLHYFVITGTMLGAAGVAAVAAYLLFRYRATVRPFTTTPKLEISLRAEVVFIVATLGLFILWWHWGFRQYVRLQVVPDGATDVYVTAKQWMWRFAYPDGHGSVGVLYAPVDRPVKLIMTSRDVIHSFFVPDFRIKQDVLPGRYTTTWFQANRPGTYQILCTEYCGAGHSTMRGEVVVLSEEDYARWLEGEKRGADGETIFPDVGAMTPMTETGLRVSAEKGCLRCHTTDGTPHIGPTWKGLYGRERTFVDGARLVADEAYLTESMMDPRARLVQGFAPVMPAYVGRLEPAEAAAIVELIKSLGETP